MQVAKKLNISRQLKFTFLILGCTLAFNTKAQSNSFSYFGTFELYNPIQNIDLKNPLFISSTLIKSEKSLAFSVPKEMPVAFFCIKEHSMDKKNRINPRFRLGSVDYVNHLEGKSN